MTLSDLQTWLYSTSSTQIVAYDASPPARIRDISETVYFLLMTEFERKVSESSDSTSTQKVLH